MAAVPTLAGEDAKRPTPSARPSLVSRPALSVASRRPWRDSAFATSFPSSSGRPSASSTCAHPGGEPIPPNTLAELRRDMARGQLIAEQIRQSEKAHLEQLKQAPKAKPNLMALLLARVIGIGIETADALNASMPCPHMYPWEKFRNTAPGRQGATHISASILACDRLRVIPDWGQDLPRFQLHRTDCRLTAPLRVLGALHLLNDVDVLPRPRHAAPRRDVRTHRGIGIAGPSNCRPD
jgi:hypothetical protein